ncbi:TrkH family potassium uptake protein [Peptostreptococcus faecalis]|uniref:TrkH family potassium uptake protein n=1 Tax=Peptostreptococcus faecalis TaxID=2045015 RepID=UPI000C7DA2BA|nr:TrkH family potassium uptake protein [Peptostreptococcus faecalis]
MNDDKKRYPSIMHRFKPAEMMVMGFLTLILIGAVLLTLPISSASGQGTDFTDCLFTSTSAVCITGLVVVDTGIYWSFFGKAIIITLVQIGGIGFMSIATLIAILLGKKINLRERILIKESLNQNDLSGAVRLIIFVVKYTLVVELVGAIFLSTVFIPKFGLEKGIWYSIFHAISAFCNAGFDLMGNVTGEYSSLIGYYNNSTIVFTVSSLIILGGIGFPVILSIKKRKKFKHWNLNSKLAVITTAILIVTGTLFIFFGEFSNASSIGGMSLGEKLQVAYFQSVTIRTAGYATIDFTTFRESTLFIMIIYMLIGASPASTGGGIKTTTVAVIFLAVKAFVKNEKEISVFKRRIGKIAFRKALVVLTLGIILSVTGTFLISATQSAHFNLLESAFEVASAVATVGSSLGGSKSLDGFGKVLISTLMFTGRVGSITLLTFFIHEKKVKSVRFPEEKIIIG